QLASERPEFVFEGNEYGQGTAGASGLVPEIIANAPPHVPPASTSISPPKWFKVGVGLAAPNALAVLLVSNSPGPGPVYWVGPPFGAVPAGSTNAQGIGTVFTPCPLTPAAIGIPVYVQWVLDDGGTRALSDAAEFVPFQFYARPSVPCGGGGTARSRPRTRAPRALASDPKEFSARPDAP